MNKKVLKSLQLSALVALFGLSLTACGETEATYVNSISNSIYGTITDFNLENGSLKSGELLKFKVTPTDDFSIDKVTVNGEEATVDTEAGDGFYQYALKGGVNKVAASFKVDSTKNYVDSFKLNVSDDVFNEIMKNPPTTEADKAATLDFRKDGIERAMTAYTDEKDYFINYVDGDTTHVSTRNYGYTVKIRYLGIDTPESTSEVEEWGKSASNYNHTTLGAAKHIILQGQSLAYKGTAATLEDVLKGEYPASADSNQRSLAYVWYSTKDVPTKSDFRCLNLEMVYQGFSYGIGSVEDIGKDFYLAFDKANKSASANSRHLYSSDKDPNFCYNAPQDLPLKTLYDTTTSGTTDSVFCDNKTLYKVHGYVTRKMDSAFYFQDKASYTGSSPEAYGMYVFTYLQTPIDVGDEVNVIGVLSSYGGAYQMQGISYHTLNPDTARDTTIVSSDNKIVPIEVTQAQFEAKCYDNVLVTITEDLYFYNKTSTYGGVTSDSAEGGVQEINKYNSHYPFYNTTNKIIAYAKAGSDTGKEIRVVSSEEILYTYKTETAWSYKFFVGGTNVYNSHGAEYANTDETNTYKSETVSTTFKRKKAHVTCISQNYLSTSGKTQSYTAVLASKADVNILGELD